MQKNNPDPYPHTRPGTNTTGDRDGVPDPSMPYEGKGRRGQFDDGGRRTTKPSNADAMGWSTKSGIEATERGIKNLEPKWMRKAIEKKKARREIQKLAKTVLREITKDARGAAREISKEKFGKHAVLIAEHMVKHGVKRATKLAIHAARKEIDKQITKNTIRAAKKLGEKITEWNEEALARAGIKVPKETYEEVADALADIYKGAGWEGAAEHFLKKRLAQAAKEAGYDIEEERMQEIYNNASTRKVAGRAAREILERMGYDTRKNEIVDQLLNNPTQKNAFKKAFKKFARKATGSAKKQLKKIADSLEEIEEAGSWEEEAEAVAEAAMEVAPVLLA